MSRSLARGALVAGRFSVDSLTGRGGAGVVYRARDVLTDQVIALKVLDGPAGERELARFVREGRLLAGLRHPGIVAHVDDGMDPEAGAYLAMEWLEGEDLARRLERSPLTLEQTMIVIRGIAETLAAAHELGIVHRDLKPSNIFLRDGAIDRPVLLDFGLARIASAHAALTQTGAVLGTPGYTAPEQARTLEVGPAADVFSLGCVLYECLAGRACFESDHYHAVIAKILFGEPPRVRQLRPDLPETLERLLQRMLARDPAARPEDARRVLAELASLGELPPLGPPDARPRAPDAVAGRVQNVTVIAALGIDPEQGGGEDLLALLSRLGAQATLLSNASLVATVASDAESAIDQAGRGARCALLIRSRWPTATIAIAMARGAEQGPPAVGDAADAAWRLVRRGAPSSEGAIRVDALIGGLLDGRFDVTRADGETLLLLGERVDLDPTRLLVGKPTPCVGRDFELGMIESMVGTCRERSEAHAAMVVAPAGLGKSRVRHELVRRLEARREDVLVLLGRADPLGAGVPYALFGDALRRRLAISSRDPIAVRRERLLARIGAVVTDGGARSVAELLGEICDVPFDELDSPKLRAARQDPRVMMDLVTEAVLTYLRAECAARPVLLVLEDLHWADAPTVRLIDRVLGELAASRLAVLAFARPEVEDRFPRVWGDRGCHVVRLPPLARKACERLVGDVLGTDTPPETTASIVDRSSGSPLFLEELIRAAADGEHGRAPPTVIAMLQARLLRLPARSRQVVARASVFGGSFRRTGVTALMGQGYDETQLDQAIRDLLDAEIVERTIGSRATNDFEYSVRQILVRDAAYDLLDGDERRRAHREAALYLEAAGDRDALVIAEHHRDGGDLERAALFYARGTEHALARNALEEALAGAQAGLACGANGAVLATLRVCQARAHFWRAELTLADPCGTEALELLEPGSVRWCQCMAAMIFTVVELAQFERFAKLSAALLSVAPAPEARAVYLEAVSMVAIGQICVGAREPALATLALMERIRAEALASDAQVHGWCEYVLTNHHYCLGSDPWAFRTSASEALACFEEAGDRRMVAASKAFVGLIEAELGDRRSAERILREGLAIVEPLREKRITGFLMMMLAPLLAEGEDRAVSEARSLANATLERTPGTIYAGFGHCALARVDLRTGALDAAERHVRQAVELLHPTPVMVLPAFTVLIDALVGQGRPRDALAVAAEGMALLERFGGSGSSELPFRLAAAEASLAAGERDEARARAAAAAQALRARAARIPDETIRGRYVGAVPAHARLAELAAALEIRA